jgi:DNA-binding NarL/FixJ family response regulator
VADDVLERGRDSWARGRWSEAYDAFARADRTAPLTAEDLERLATAAYMTGRDDEQHRALERAHQAHLDDGERLRAVRCAIWLGVHLLLRREVARASGWFGRAQRLFDRDGSDCVERGYLLMVSELRHAGAGEWEAAYAAAAAAAEVAERFGDANLLALCLMDQGRSLIRQGRVADGLGKLDQAMVEATAGELSPIVLGLVYCSVIDGCQEVHELRRAHEWTAALAEWCDHQPGLVPFTGTCLMHRSELLELRGEWEAALAEARLAGERFATRSNNAAAGQAWYRQGEVLRLRGELAGAEDAYREASRLGHEPQPGLALLRVAQGRIDAAAAAIGQLTAATSEWVERARLLPAFVEIMLAAGHREEARAACDELEELAERHGATLLRARAAQARGAVGLADRDAHNALLALRSARRLWQEIEAPYEDARARVLIARASRAVGDEETARLELVAAHAVFERVGAAPDVASVGSLLDEAGPGETGRLTDRELQVLRLVAAGRSNRAIAGELVLSKRTVDRHVMNIFAKLGVTSRAAATAYAYEHGLL